jgi:chemotaxis protein MotB
MARRFKKVEGGHGHHGGAWKVAYADFVTAMMALFMVLWLLASTDAASRKEISQYFRSGILPEGDLSMNRAAQVTPSVMEQSPQPPPPEETAAIEANTETAKQISSKLDRLAALDADMAQIIRNVRIKVTSEGVLIETIDEDKGLLFDVASSRLSPALEKFLKAFAPMVAKVNRPVEINGHTDARPFTSGARKDNWDLSYERAVAARQILETNGVPPKLVVGLFARGSSQLYTPDQPLDAQNRRLSFLLKTAKSRDVTKRVDDLK